MRYLILLVLLLIASSASAIPSITNVSGTITDGATITITGSGFGTGPTVGLFDKFDGGINGSNVSLSSPSIGTWYAYDTPATPPTYNTNLPHSGSSAMYWGYDRGLRYSFPSLQTEVFISYWVRLDSDQIFPRTTQALTLPVASAWKISWLLHGTTSGTDDLCVPTMASPPNWSIAGNDSTMPVDNFQVGTLSTTPNSGWFSYTGWIRVAAWLKAGANPIVDNATIYFQGTNGNAQYAYTKTNAPMWAGTGTHGWDHWFFGLWTDSSTVSRPLFDDVYLAYGTGAASRIEIGDANTYLACTHLEIVPHTTWADGSITANVRVGSFTGGTSAFLYVIDSTNTPSASYAITFTGDTTVPTVTAFSIGSTNKTLTIPINTFVSTDNVGVSSYCISETNSSTNCIWQNTPPLNYKPSRNFNGSIYGFTKDAAGNISNGFQATGSTVINKVKCR